MDIKSNQRMCSILFQKTISGIDELQKNDVYQFASGLSALNPLSDIELGVHNDEFIISYYIPALGEPLCLPSGYYLANNTHGHSKYVLDKYHEKIVCIENGAEEICRNLFGQYVKYVKTNIDLIDKSKGIDYKKLTLANLRHLVEQYKNFPADKRLMAYIEYFVNFGSYDTSQSSALLESLDKGDTEDANQKKENLWKFLDKGTGVCDQFAKALSLISVIDTEIPKCYYVVCKMTKDGKELGHALNMVEQDGKPSIIDISSMIHSKQGDYKLNKNKFAFVHPEEYIKSMESLGFVWNSPARKTKNKMFHFVVFMHLSGRPEDCEDYYELLNLPAKEQLVLNKEMAGFMLNVPNY